MRHVTLILLLACLPTDNTRAQDSAAEPSLAAQAGSILRRCCSRCHRESGGEAGFAFNILDIETVIDEGMLVPEDPESSDIFQFINKGYMPPQNRHLPRPSGEEIQIIRAWINAGAEEIPEQEERAKVTLKDELTSIRDHLQQASAERRINLRFFSLTHLHNDTTVAPEQLRMTRMAFSKALNSLSWQSELVRPIPLNAEQTVYAVDITQLGWGRDHWLTLDQAYPYSLAYGGLDLALDDLDKEIRKLRTGEAVDTVQAAERTATVIRADWLIAVATKPPIYHQLLYDLHLPSLRARRDVKSPNNPKQMTDLDLERHLGVDVLKNIQNNTAQRGGFTESGVSGQNRLIERHPLKDGGYYWKSYDFKASTLRASLTEFPLGPRFDGNPFQGLAFDHDGGEIIFSLPNGLQAYLLVDAKGNRIDAGPIEVVADSLRTSGNEQIFSGVSCIACHRRGMLEPPTDEVRRFARAVNTAKRKVLSLYPEDAEFRLLIADDEERFVTALEALLEDQLGGQNLEDLPEPVGEVARHYHLETLTSATIAAELFVTPKQLIRKLNQDRDLQELGLGVLLREGGGIKRAAWESPTSIPLMLRAARRFGYSRG